MPNTKPRYFTVQSDYTDGDIIGPYRKTQANDTLVHTGTFLIDGQVITKNGYQEDLRFPASGINPPGTGSDPLRDTTTGLLNFENAKTEIIAGAAQMPHGWLEGTSIIPHIHIRATTADPAGTANVRWTLNYKWYNNDAALPAAYTTDTKDFVLPAHVAGQPVNLLANFTAVSGTGKTVSSLFEWKLSRIGGTDTYNDTCVLVEFDIHYQHNKFGKDT